MIRDESFMDTVPSHLQDHFTDRGMQPLAPAKLAILKQAISERFSVKLGYYILHFCTLWSLFMRFSALLIWFLLFLCCSLIVVLVEFFPLWLNLATHSC